MVRIIRIDNCADCPNVDDMHKKCTATGREIPFETLSPPGRPVMVHVYPKIPKNCPLEKYNEVL